MTTTVERTPIINKISRAILKENFWAFMISVISIAVVFYLLWSITIPKSTPLAFIFLFFVPVPVLISIFLNFMRVDGEFIWVQPILVLIFSVAFVGFFYSETGDHNYLKYPEYKQTISSNPDLKEFNELKVKPDFNKIEKDGVIQRYEMMQIFDAMEVIQVGQRKIESKKEKAENERQAKQIKASFGQ